MLKVERTEVLGWEASIRGMRNPLNSWDKSDSYYGCCGEKCEDCCHQEKCGKSYFEYHIGQNDLDLMKRLVKAGSDHSKFMRMITVYCDITAPLYFFKEFDTYKVGTVANSCSTMHKIHAKEFTLDDFSHEHLMDYGMELLEKTIETLNDCRDIYNNGYVGNGYTIKPKSKEYWYEMIQLLPSSYNQKRTVQLNYAVLRNMYHSRKNHKLDEWHTFCEWISSLPYSELITM